MRALALVMLVACAIEPPRRGPYRPTVATIELARHRIEAATQWLQWSISLLDIDPHQAIYAARRGITELGHDYARHIRGIKDDTSLHLAIIDEREASGDDVGAATDLQNILRVRIELYFSVFKLAPR